MLCVRVKLEVERYRFGDFTLECLQQQFPAVQTRALPLFKALTLMFTATAPRRSPSFGILRSLLTCADGLARFSCQTVATEKRRMQWSYWRPSRVGRSSDGLPGPCLAICRAASPSSGTSMLLSSDQIGLVVPHETLSTELPPFVEHSQVVIEWHVVRDRVAAA